MKDQRRLANRCLEKEIPFFTLCGDDILALPVLEYYYKLAEDHKCNKTFLDDLKELIGYYEHLSNTEPEMMKKPD